MKSLTRTIIVLVIINLTIGNFALAKNTSSEGPESSESAARSGARMPRRPEPVQPGAVPPVSTPIEPTPPIASGLRTVTISGEIRVVIDSKTLTGLSGVEILGLPGNPVTDENGFYAATVPYGFSGTVIPRKKGYTFMPVSKNCHNIIDNQQYYFTAKRIGPAPIFMRTGSRKVLVIPATKIEAENLAAITEDLLVMSHIFDERFREGQEIQGIFVDLGDIFGRDNRSTEAIYMQGYGALFLMEVNFTFSPEPKPQEQEVQENEEYIDPDWQRAKQKLFSPPGFGGNYSPEEQYSAQQIEQIKAEFIRTLKHAANIRNLQPDEWIILTVIGQGRQAGGMYEDYYRITGSRSRRSGSRSRSSSGGRSPYGGSGAMGGGIGGGVMMGGSMGGMAGGGMGGQAFGGGVMMGGGMMDGMAYGDDTEYGETGPASTTVLTIRAKKSDVDDFARGELDFEQFQQKVDIFTY